MENMTFYDFITFVIDFVGLEGSHRGEPFFSWTCSPKVPNIRTGDETHQLHWFWLICCTEKFKW